MRPLLRVSTGVAGLDDVLHGGLPAQRMYLVHGTPGVGKTTLAMQFLLAGVERGETVLYVSLSETEAEIRQVVQSHGWSLDGVSLYDLAEAEAAFTSDENTLYATEDVELRETMSALFERLEKLAPSRVVFDSLSEIRALAQTGTAFRRQVIALKRFFSNTKATVLLLDDRTSEDVDSHVESLAHGVIALGQSAMRYGRDRRQLRVVKLRGSPFRSGHHDFDVRSGGLVVYPRLVAFEHRSALPSEALPSGNRALDAMLGGGLSRATATLVVGPAGVGKSGLSLQFVDAALARGEAATIFLFEERAQTLLERGRQLGMKLDGGNLVIRQVDPAELAPDELTHLVRQEVEERGCRVLVIDSINGYFTAMPDEGFLTLQMHELLAYLADQGVATVMTMSQAGVVGTMTTPIDLSYLSDTVILLRYYESEGRMRKAVSVLKKRSGPHEDTIRELSFGAGGILVGEPLARMRGILTGVPAVVPTGTGLHELVGE